MALIHRHADRSHTVEPALLALHKLLDFCPEAGAQAVAAGLLDSTSFVQQARACRASYACSG